MIAILTALLLMSAADTKTRPGDAVFTPAKVLAFHLTLEAAEFTRMQPKAAGGGGFFGGFRPGGPPPAAPAAGTKRNTFGMELPTGKGDLTFDGKTYRAVGVRYKGNFTVMASRGLKKSLKIDLDLHTA